jgi:hypothetical protein
MNYPAFPSAQRDRYSQMTVDRSGWHRHPLIRLSVHSEQFCIVYIVEIKAPKKKSFSFTAKPSMYVSLFRTHGEILLHNVTAGTKYSEHVASRESAFTLRVRLHVYESVYDSAYDFMHDLHSNRTWIQFFICHPLQCLYTHFSKK